MYPHRIRLRGPWECEPLASDLLPRRVFMPSGWLDAGLAGFRGKACFSRKFGYPGNADPATEHIWLTCDGLSGCRTIVLNGKTLSEDACTSFSFDVTKLLAQRNKLDVTIEGTNETEGLWARLPWKYARTLTSAKSASSARTRRCESWGESSALLIGRLSFTR